jgi:hypothetical protein
MKGWLPRLTPAGWLLVLATAAATVGWFFLLDLGYRHWVAPGRTDRSFAALMVGFPVLFFLAGGHFLGRRGYAILRD